MYRVIYRANGEVFDDLVVDDLDKAVASSLNINADTRGSIMGIARTRTHKLFIIEEGLYGNVLNIYNEHGKDCAKNEYEHAIYPLVYLHIVARAGRWTFRNSKSALDAIPKIAGDFFRDIPDKFIFALTNYNQSISLGRYNEKGVLVWK